MSAPAIVNPTITGRTATKLRATGRGFFSWRGTSVSLPLWMDRPDLSNDDVWLPVSLASTNRRDAKATAPQVVKFLGLPEIKPLIPAKSAPKPRRILTNRSTRTKVTRSFLKAGWTLEESIFYWDEAKSIKSDLVGAARNIEWKVDAATLYDIPLQNAYRREALKRNKVMLNKFLEQIG